jgi:hypothetical protein
MLPTTNEVAVSSPTFRSGRGLSIKESLKKWKKTQHSYNWPDSLFLPRQKQNPL